eukprot:gnl/TRDRNA2_/TRDRNA2_139422_c1_seq2.p1 gnl/TRDRNA2_/TRDRNA2_139422_c1~~gnl/TRDRNA2_/TRDRNA2_139422_c1_seq2.p1  ORF type:complete len:534 (-),score=68.20 gnl/TRDRNA2_/TRDRNA2_139422_c1_seq2:157-1758(-)
MRSTMFISYAFAVNVLLANLTASAQASTDNMVDMLMHRLFDQALKAYPLRDTVLENTMFGKFQGHVALPPVLMVGNPALSLCPSAFRRKNLLDRSTPMLSASKASGFGKPPQTNKRKEKTGKDKKVLRPAHQEFQLAEVDRYSQEATRQLQLGRPLEALECYKHAIDVHPSHAASHISMGELLSALQRTSEAVETLQTAVQLEPKQVRAWALLGALHRDSGALAEAQEALKTAVLLAPDDPRFRIILASVLLNVGCFHESFNQFQAAQTAFEKLPKSTLLTMQALAAAQKSALAFAPDIIASSSVNRTHVPAKGGHVAALLRRSAFRKSIPAEWIDRLRQVHVTPVATKAECEWAIATAETHAAAMGGWDGRGHHHAYQTNSIVVADHEELRKWVQALLRDRIWPAINLQFDINQKELWLEDCFLIKYEANGQAGLKRHFDNSEISFNLLLSDPASFEGGGTAFADTELEEVTVQPAQGEVITHFGLVSHEGKPVLGGGPRYILAGFVRAEPLAKRWRELRGKPVEQEISRQG